MNSEQNFFIELRSPTEYNRPWLENRAIAMEEALIEQMAGRVFGPSVTANFSINGFEVDLTLAVDSPVEQQALLDEVMRVIERAGGITVPPKSDQVTEIRSEYRDLAVSH